MKICIVTTAFPRWKNDSRAPFILEAAKSIARQGIEVKVIASHSPGAKTHEFIDGIEVFRPRYFPEKWENLHREPGGIPEAWKTQKIGRFAIFPFMIAQLFAVFRYSKDCDILHANWTIAGFNAWINKCLFRKPYIITLQGSDIYKAAKLSIARSITFRVLNSASKIITLSNSLKDEILKFKNLEGKIDIIPNGVDTKLFFSNVNNRENFIIYTGALIKRKGVDILINAMSVVVKNDSEVKLFILGEGNEAINLKGQVNNLGLRDKINFMGQVSQESVKDWLKKSKLFVLPSLEEGQGVVLIEALACGTPCIGSNVGGIPDVISDDVGSLVPPNDPDSLAKSILYYLENEEEWLKKSENARLRAKEIFDWDVIAKKLVSIYNTILTKEK